MKYSCLQVRGALNETGDKSRGRQPERLAAGELRRRRISDAVISLVPESLARDHTVIPLAFDGETLTCAAAEPEDLALEDKLSFSTAKKIRLVGAPQEEIRETIARHYGAGEGESADAFLAESCLADGTLDFVESPPVRAKRDHRPAIARSLLRRMPAGSREYFDSSADRDAGQSLDETPWLGGKGMLFYVVEEGQRVLMRKPDGTMEVLVGPTRVWRGRNHFRPMVHHVAHPGEFLIVRYRDGRQEHLPGPAGVWFDPRVHREILQEDALQIAAKEAVVVYSRDEDAAKVSRSIVYGPALFVLQPGQWLHTFSWHASAPDDSSHKVPGALVFQKLWLMSDQMYHDVTDVRTADDAVLTIRLMIFFQLTDIERMLDSTHDPIGDFVNAATSDVVDFLGRHDFESFKRNTDRLNELETYRQLTARAAQCGYAIHKVVYRGYGATASLQQMHDQAIEARTRLQLERATEQQAQDLENYKLESQLARASKRRTEQAAEVEHDLRLAQKREEAELRKQQARRDFALKQDRQEAESRLDVQRLQDAEQREHLTALAQLGVDLTAYLTQGRADRVIEVRGGRTAHLHLDPLHTDGKSDPPPAK
jgi:hypothetical protein